MIMYAVGHVHVHIYIAICCPLPQHLICLSYPIHCLVHMVVLDTLHIFQQQPQRFPHGACALCATQGGLMLVHLPLRGLTLVCSPCEPAGTPSLLSSSSFRRPNSLLNVISAGPVLPGESYLLRQQKGFLQGGRSCWDNDTWSHGF